MALKRAKSDLAAHSTHLDHPTHTHTHPCTSHPSHLSASFSASAEESERERRRLSDARKEAEEALGLTAGEAWELERLALGFSAGGAGGSAVDLLGSQGGGTGQATPAAEAKVGVSKERVEGVVVPDVREPEPEPASAPETEVEAQAKPAEVAENGEKEEEKMEVDPAVSGEVTTPTEEASTEVSEVDTDASLTPKSEVPSPAPVSTVSSTPSSSPAHQPRPRPRRLVSAPPRKTTISDFDIMRVLGKGCAGKVLMVRHRKTDGVYAMKSIQKGHVLAHRELQHTLTEQSVLKRVADEQSNPFIVRLWWSFHDSEHLFLVMDFYNGGDLATQLARWGRLGRDRARFYAAEICEGLQGLHAAGVIYRDLKPENVLIAADGHVVLTDFGLSRQFPRGNRGEEGEGRVRSLRSYDRETTSTFCGTAEYLAPEVIKGHPYSYEVDWWSFGTMLYEMLTGQTPFWSDDHAVMYRRVLHEELTFGEDSRLMDEDTRTLLRGLLARDPAVRMTGARVKRHPYFGMIDWEHVFRKRYIPPYVPDTNPEDATDTQNFDDAFLSMEPTYFQDDDEDPPRSPNRDEQHEPEDAFDEHGRDVFDGYSYLAPSQDRDSVYDYNDEDEPEDSQDVEEASEIASQAVDVGPAEEDLTESYDRGSSSLRTSSTRPTSVEKDPSATSSGRHDRVSSQGLGSLAEDGDETGETEQSEADHDEDWDVVAAPAAGMWDRNGKRGNTLFARGVVDKYRMRMLRSGDQTPPSASRVLPRLPRRGSSQVSVQPSDSETGTGTGLSSRLSSAPASRSSSAHGQSRSRDSRRFKLRSKRPPFSSPRSRTPDSARLSEHTLGPHRKSTSDPAAFDPKSPTRKDRKTKMKRLGLSTPRTLFSPSKSANSSPPRTTTAPQQ